MYIREMTTGRQPALSCLWPEGIMGYGNEKTSQACWRKKTLEKGCGSMMAPPIMDETNDGEENKEYFSN